MPGFKPPKGPSALYEYVTQPWFLMVVSFLVVLPLVLMVFVEIEGIDEETGQPQKSKLGQLVARYFAGYSMSRRR